MTFKTVGQVDVSRVYNGKRRGIVTQSCLISNGEDKASGMKCLCLILTRKAGL